MKKNVFLGISMLLLLMACKKEKPVEPTKHPEMNYVDLQNAEVKYQQTKKIDYDNDGIDDLSFGVLLVGDPILEIDRLQFYANAKNHSGFLIDARQESLALNKFDVITKNYEGYTWVMNPATILCEKITDNNGSHWTGPWADANRKYLPLQITKNEKTYNGWVEISFDKIGEKLVLHKIGLSTEENKDVKAGF
ncbi:hypothetical protein [Solitalea lacus]|uniref:hypothetical protein n=1 Tax=Solitalea lacus TaxID=2911172 RepID=UPI001EDC7278|nr:hypothetical protein [Solitalea lacus]UKJ06662.1 hypothetical protein L2B55_14125 [Solitalea lacus]